MGWLLLWGKRRSPFYGAYVPSKVQAWGYVFWDEQRWPTASKLIQQQWLTHHEEAEAVQRELGWNPGFS
ncbi:hypothetical protein B0T21DRAFT_377587 [Apiosordaria backusii]|uniref:Uncharacterized protein n=1 Tax=Apiosordaria backusii TaxID=314023 RepID=A0AA39ZYI0_9PEZI|nr:hypothetical protein B0T21DRAFT_377587 [Apiosordaria backusii]